MNLRDLRYLVAVAEQRHFGRAAEACHVSQPTLSAQIKKLEDNLGVTLFERTNRRVMSTEIGEEIIGSARRILTEVATIEQAARLARDPLSGTFRLGAFPTLASYIFPEVIPPITKAMPKLRLILVEEKTDLLLDKLRRGALDAAFIALPVADDFLVSRKLFDDPFYLAVNAGHDLARAKAVPPDTLDRNRLLLLEDGHCLRDQALDVCQSVGAGEDPDLRATSLETLRQMVKANTGITLMPEIAIERGEKGIVYIPFSGSSPSRSIGLVWRKTCHRIRVLDQITDIVLELRSTDRNRRPDR